MEFFVQRTHQMYLMPKQREILIIPTIILIKRNPLPNYEKKEKNNYIS